MHDKVEHSLPPRGGSGNEVKDKLHQIGPTRFSGGQQQRLCIAARAGGGPGSAAARLKPCSALEPDSPTAKIEGPDVQPEKTKCTQVIVNPPNMQTGGAGVKPNSPAFFPAGAKLIRVSIGHGGDFSSGRRKKKPKI